LHHSLISPLPFPNHQKVSQQLNPWLKIYLLLSISIPLFLIAPVIIYLGGDLEITAAGKQNCRKPAAEAWGSMGTVLLLPQQRLGRQRKQKNRPIMEE
jgi:hypothetical protein